MGYFYIGIMLFMKMLQCIFNKKTSDCLNGRSSFISYSFYNYIMCTLMSVIMLFFTTFQGKMQPFAVLPVIGISALAGISMAVCSITSLAALQGGTITLCNLASGAGILIPCVAGVFMFQESISLWQGVGVLLLLVSAYLLIGCSKETYGKMSVKVVVLLFLSLVSNGLTMVAQKMFSFYFPDVSTGIFSFIAFASATLILLFFLVFQGKTQGVASLKLAPSILGYGAILAGALFAINLLSTITASLVPSVILFNLVNGGGMVIAAIVGATMFKQPLTIKSAMGVAIGIGSLIIINLF